MLISCIRNYKSLSIQHDVPALKFRSSILITLLLGGTSRLAAQYYQASICHYGVENGLSHREVEAVFQDYDGFIWLGTRFGLNRFGGHHFTSWTQPRRGLHFNDISRIFQDDAGWLWLFNGDQTFVFLHARSGEVRRAEERLGTTLPFQTSSEVWQYDLRSPAAEYLSPISSGWSAWSTPSGNTWPTRSSTRNLSPKKWPSVVANCNSWWVCRLMPVSRKSGCRKRVSCWQAGSTPPSKKWPPLWVIPTANIFPGSSGCVSANCPRNIYIKHYFNEHFIANRPKLPGVVSQFNGLPGEIGGMLSSYLCRTFNNCPGSCLTLP